MLPLNAGSGALEAQAPSAQKVPEHLSDMVLAHAVVHAIRAVKGVVDMGQGLSALLRMTDHIRAVVSQTFEHLGLPAPTLVDVAIDDIR